MNDINASTTTSITGIYGITPADVSLTWLRQNLETAFRAGLRLLQLRDKQITNRLQRALAVHQLCQQYNVCLIINDDIQLARDCGANGVHLGRSDFNISLPKAKTSHFIIGVSCQGDAKYAYQMLDNGATYLSFGAVCPSKTKIAAMAIGIKKTQQLCQQIHNNYPQACIVAIGGIGVQEIKQLRQQDIQAVAVSAALWQGNVTENMQVLQRVWNKLN